MVARGCRIVISFVALLALLLAVALSIAAATTPQWQVAELDQVNQLRYIGLYQSCAFGSRQGQQSPMTWVCVFIPYGQGYLGSRFDFGAGRWQNFGKGALQGSTEVDYTAYGGEAWRFATLILFMLATFFGFLSFVFELAEVCLDATRTVHCLKAMSGFSLASLVFATICSICGILTFTIESQESQNMYIMELTAFAIFQWGQSFYIGVAAVIMFLIALGIDVGATALVCATAKPHRAEIRQRLFYLDNDGANPNSNSKKHLYETEKRPMIERSVVEPPKHHDEAGMAREQSFNNYYAEPQLWKYPKVTWV